jgi:AcrR family transcriptional regulator
VTRSRPKEDVRRARSALYRQIILEAAERCFAMHGVDDAKMEEVAAESGLSLGTLYSVFSGKAVLVQAIHETRLREVLRRAIEVARGRDDTLEVLLKGVGAYVEFFVVHPDYLRMHLREGVAWGLGHDVAGSRRRAEAWNDGMDMLTALFARGVAEGRFHPGEPRQMARMMIAMQQVQLAGWLESAQTTPPEQLMAEIEAQLRRSFCLGPAG